MRTTYIPPQDETNRLRRLRREQGWTADQLGQLLGISRSNIVRLERRLPAQLAQPRLLRVLLAVHRAGKLPPLWWTWERLPDAEWCRWWCKACAAFAFLHPAGEPEQIDIEHEAKRSPVQP